MSFIKFLKEASATTFGKVAMGLMATFALSVSYRYVLKPNLDRRRRHEAELMAEYLFEQELQHKSKMRHE